MFASEKRPFKRRLGVDFDDVLFGFVEGWCAFHALHYGTTTTREDIHTYYMEELYGISHEEMATRINHFHETSYHAAMKPIAGAFEALLALSDQWEPLIVTARPLARKHLTLELLARHAPSLLDSVHFCGSMAPGVRVSKADTCRELDIEVFIDDAAHNIEDVAPVVRLALLLDAPWNRSYEPVHSNIVRVHTWAEVPEILSFR